MEVSAIGEGVLIEVEKYVYVIEINLLQRSFRKLLTSEKKALVDVRYITEKERQMLWNILD